MNGIPDCDVCRFKETNSCTNCYPHDSRFERDPDKVAAVKNISAITFKPMWYHDICEKSIYVTSKSQLKEECKKHDVISCRLM